MKKEDIRCGALKFQLSGNLFCKRKLQKVTPEDCENCPHLKGETQNRPSIGEFRPPTGYLGISNVVTKGSMKIGKYCKKYVPKDEPSMSGFVPLLEYKDSNIKVGIVELTVQSRNGHKGVLVWDFHSSDDQWVYFTVEFWQCSIGQARECLQAAGRIITEKVSK